MTCDTKLNALQKSKQRLLWNHCFTHIKSIIAIVSIITAIVIAIVVVM